MGIPHQKQIQSLIEHLHFAKNAYTDKDTEAFEAANRLLWGEFGFTVSFEEPQELYENLQND